MTCVWLLSALLLAALLPGGSWKRPVSSDGYYYYIWLRSVWYDHDLDLRNDYQSTGNPYSFPPTQIGRADNVFPIGSAVLWAPFFAAGKISERILPGDGDPGLMTIREQRSVSIGTLVYGFVGLLLLASVCSRIAGQTSSLLSVMSLLWGTFLSYYLTAKPSMSEGCSFFSQALVLFLISGTREASIRLRYLCVGAVLGLSAAVRYHNMASVFLLLWLLPVMWKNGVRAFMFRTGLLVAGFLLGFSPQAYVLFSLYGSPLTLGTAQSFIAPDGLNILPTLASPYHGLFYFHPIALIGLVGLVARLRRGGWESRAVFLAFVFHVCAVSIGADVGAAFGARKFSGSLPLLATGLTYIIECVWTRGRSLYRVAAVVVLLTAVSWNLVLWDSLGSKLSARESASVASLIAGEPHERDAPRMRTVYFGRGSIPSGVLEGWSEVDSDAETSFRRLEGGRGVMRLVLPKEGALQCTLRARSVGSAPIRIRLAIGKAWSSELEVGRSWGDTTFLISMPGTSGAARLVFTLTTDPAAEGPSAPRGDLAVAWVSLKRVATP